MFKISKHFADSVNGTACYGGLMRLLKCGWVIDQVVI